MTGLSTWTRLAGGVVAAVLTVSLASCSDSEKEQKPAAGASKTAAEEGYPYDTSDVGDDLLVEKRSSSSFGGNAPASWRFPAFYANGTTDETSTTTEVDGVTFGLLAVASTGSTPRKKAEEYATRLDKGTEIVQEVSLGGRDWVAVVDDGKVLTRVLLLTGFPGGVTAGAVLTADVPLADVPPERIDELHQVAQSIQIEAGSSR
ncbi:hypothetical protein GEV29_09880 [Aeromicrobium sp. SMF47]|uniref:hypothetical protein n=1 Tax=Aeromicrobium yanjiei TaxID=2662028 RepID=UPI00129DC6B7|nr:hypothetical protein [Aeromicrobium yanjiei]MRJ76845.1 hypothetical protein [Aeromicrobium yanjiei]